MRWLKSLKSLALLMILVPQFAFAANTTVSFNATTSTGTIFVTPNKLNGIFPNVASPFFFATSLTASSTFNNGININGGCVSVRGVCLGGGSGTVTNVATDGTLTGGPITTTGTLGINLANANTWTGLQAYSNAGTTTYAGGIYASLLAGPYFIATSTLQPSVLPLASTTVISASGASSVFALGADTTAAPAIAIGTGGNNANYAFGISGGRGMIGFDTIAGNMLFNSGAQKGIQFKANGANNTFNSGTAALTIVNTVGSGAAGNSAFGTSSSYATIVTIGTSTVPQLALSSNVPADPTWNLRSIAGSFFLASSTAAGTSTTAAFSIAPTGAITTMAMKWDAFRHPISSGNLPTAGTCGTSPTITAASDDATGEIVIGTGVVSSCAINFASTWTSIPHCTVDLNITGATTTILAAQTSATVLTVSGNVANMGGSKLDWICMSN